MFTGIIEAIGTLQKTEKQPSGDLRITIDSQKLDLADVKLGDSIACNGCCLTVVELTKHSFAADVSTESLKLTTLGLWQQGDGINLEKSLMPTSRMGGHMVSGHVDGMAKVISRVSSARAEVFWLQAPKGCAQYIAKKGSVTIDGTSLTVNEVESSTFSITIIPHTLKETVIDAYQTGTSVNLEVDLIARYLERLTRSQAKQTDKR